MVEIHLLKLVMRSFGSFNVSSRSCRNNEKSKLFEILGRRLFASILAECQNVFLLIRILLSLGVNEVATILTGNND